MVARKELSRKALFAAALVEAGLTLPGFASISGVSNTQLRRTVGDPSASAPLSKKIDAFIEQYVGNRITAGAA